MRRNKLGFTGLLGLVGLLLVAVGCGAESRLPTHMKDAMREASAAMKSDDPEAMCGSVHSIQNSLYEWQEFARGNQHEVIERTMQGLDQVAIGCGGMRGMLTAPAEIDVAQLRDNYETWAAEVRKATTKESSFGNMFLWFFGCMVLGGFLMFARRKFREA